MSTSLHSRLPPTAGSSTFAVLCCSNMTVAYDLYQLCRLLETKSVEHADVQAAVRKLDRRVPPIVIADNGRAKIRRSAPDGSSIPSVVLRCLRRTAEDYQTLMSVGTGLNSKDFLKMQKDEQRNLARTYVALADSWGQVVGQTEPDKLAVATAASKADVFPKLATVFDHAAAQLSAVSTAVPPNPGSEMSSDVMLAISLVRVWQNFVTHWPSSGSVLIGKHLALLAQPAARLIMLLLHSANKIMQHTALSWHAAAAADLLLLGDDVLFRQFQAAADGSLVFARSVSKETNAASPAAASSQQGGIALQDVLNNKNVLEVFSIGAVCYTLGLQNLLQPKSGQQHPEQPQGVSGDSSKDAAGIRQNCSAVQRLLKALQLDVLYKAFFMYLKTAWDTQQWVQQMDQPVGDVLKQLLQALHSPSNRLAIPTDTFLQDEAALHEAVMNVCRGITQVCSSIRQTAQIQQQQDLGSFAAITSLLSCLKGLLCAVLCPGQAPSTAAAETSLLALDAMLAIWDTQVTAAAGTASAAARCKTSNQDIVDSTTTVEECLRLAGATSCGILMLKQQALSAVSIITVHKLQLLGFSASLNKSVRSLAITCLKLAQAYSSWQPEQAATLARKILNISTEVAVKGVHKPSKLRGADQQATAAAVAFADAAVECVAALAGRCLFTIGSALQHAATDQRRQQQQEEAVEPVYERLPWLLTTIDDVRTWVIGTSFTDELMYKQQGAVVGLRKTLSNIQADMLEVEMAGSLPLRDTSAGRDQLAAPAALHAQVGRALADYGAKLSTEFPVPYCCNNPSCVNMSHESELLLVSGKGSICSGCRKARYCSKSCQKQHWKQHKPVCMKLRSVAVVD